MTDLTGKTALVTGASRGIGRAIAVGLARAGADLALSARDEGLLQEVRAEAHVEALLRELSLVVGDDDLPPSTARVARAVLQAAAGMDAVRADVKHQLAIAVSAGQPRIDLTLTIQRDDAEVVRDFSHAIDEADRHSRAGKLLTTPAPPELSETRQRYLRRVLAQLTS